MAVLGPQANLNPIHEDELQIGDIIFDMDANGHAIHVSVYAGKRHGTHFVTHAVTGNYNSMMTTRLKPDHFSRRVFRCQDSILAFNVAALMFRWVMNQIPFSLEKHEKYTDRLESAPFSHPQTGAKAECDYSESLYASNFFRYIEYAAHPELPFVATETNMDGFYCSEAIVAAYQIESLKMLNAIKFPDGVGVMWVQDRSVDAGVVSPPGYSEYCQQLQPQGELSSHCAYLRSYQVWNTSLFGDNITEFAKTMELPLKLDSITAGPGAIFQYFSKNTNMWIDCGKLDVKPLELGSDEVVEDDKKKWREYVNTLFSQSVSHRNHAMNNYKAHSDSDIGGSVFVARPRSKSMSDFTPARNLEAQIRKDVQRSWRKHHSKLSSPTKSQLPKTIGNVRIKPRALKF